MERVRWGGAWRYDGELRYAAGWRIVVWEDALALFALAFWLAMLAFWLIALEWIC